MLDPPRAILRTDPNFHTGRNLKRTWDPGTKTLVPKLSSRYTWSTYHHVSPCFPSKTQVHWDEHTTWKWMGQGFWRENNFPPRRNFFKYTPGNHRGIWHPLFLEESSLPTGAMSSTSMCHPHHRRQTEQQDASEPKPLLGKAAERNICVVFVFFDVKDVSSVHPQNHGLATPRPRKTTEINHPNRGKWASPMDGRGNDGAGSL